MTGLKNDQCDHKKMKLQTLWNDLQVDTNGIYYFNPAGWRSTKAMIADMEPLEQFNATKVMDTQPMITEHGYS